MNQRMRRYVVSLAAMGLLVLVSTAALAQPFVPVKPDLTGIVVDEALSRVLGKALFFDEQVGSDGQACASCHFHAGADIRTKNVLSPGQKALNKAPGGDIMFGVIRSDTGAAGLGNLISNHLAGPNVTLRREDFPFHKLTDPFDGQSAIAALTNDVASSPGAVGATFNQASPSGNDQCADVDASVFGIGNGHGRLAVRRTEPRNTPTVFNAALLLRTFLDGRANEEFNGVDVFGPRTVRADPTKRLLVRAADGSMQLRALSLRRASLASLAVGPALSELEMSCGGRSFPDVGRRLLERQPLALQRVHRTDDLLGEYRVLPLPPIPGVNLGPVVVNPPNLTGKGLRGTYRAMVEAAFHPRYWAAEGRWRITPSGNAVADPDGFTQAELNFSLFFGVAVMQYIHTLISDRSEFDRLRAAGRIVTENINNTNLARCTATDDGVDPLLTKGCTLFAGLGGCTACHNSNQQLGQAGQDSMPMLTVGSMVKGNAFNLVIGGGRRSTPQGGGPTPRIHRDQGFAGTGVRVFFDDLLLGGTDPYGNPLSYMRQLRRYALAVQGGASLAQALDAHVHDSILREDILAGKQYAGVVPTGALGIDGAPKIPGMRNVMLTPPYMANGGMATIREVLEFYNRGGNLRTITAATAALEASDAGKECVAGDTSGTGPVGDSPFPLEGVTDCGSNTGAGVQKLNLVDCNDPSHAQSCAAEGLTSETDDLGAMVRFFKSLTDERVQRNACPFCGPEQHIVNGHDEFEGDRNGVAKDIVVTIPATGMAGFREGSPCIIPPAGDLFAPGMDGRLSGCREDEE